MRCSRLSLRLFSVCLLIAASRLSGQSPAHKEGVALYQQRKYPEAAEKLQTAAKDEEPSSPEFKESALFIGQSLFMMNQASKCIPWLEKAGPSNEANYMLGYAYLLNHEPGKSEGAFARLFGVEPGSAGAHLVTGQMLLKREFDKEAAEEVRKAIQLDPKLAEAHFVLGEIEISHGEFEEGLADLTIEVGLNPNFSMAWFRRGDAYTRKDNWAAAIADLQRAIWLNQNFSSPYILLGKCYLKQKDYSNAENMLRRALSLDPQNQSATYLLAQVLVAEDKKAEAKELLEKLRMKDQRQQ